MARGKEYWLPVIGLVAAMAIWASSFIALKVAFRTFDPMVVVFARMVLGSMCFMIMKRGFRGLRYVKGDWKLIVGMALFEPCLSFLLEAYALLNTTASQAGMITAMLPLMVAVAARIFLKETITRRTAFGFSLAIVGAAWLSLAADSSERAPHPILGNFLEFLALASTVGYVILLKKLTARYSPFFLTAMQAFIGAIFYFPILFLPSTQMPADYNPTAVLAVLWLGTIVTVGAYGLYNYGLSRIPANQASAFINLIPIMAVFLAWLLLDETFTFQQYIASVLVFAGVFISQDRPKEG